MKQFVVRLIVRLTVALGLTGGGFRAFGQHVHLYSGAVTPTEGAQLALSNRALYDTNSNGGITPECFFMSDNYPSLYPGLYQSDATFVALPATPGAFGPAPGAAAPGAYIQAKVISVSGPAKGVIRFWQEAEDASATTNIFTVPVGTSYANIQFNVSEGIVTPEYGPDPFGHIHGRRFTANIPGLYVMGFQLVDTSTNGSGGGPIHTPSVTNYFFFQAGVMADSYVKSNNTFTLQFGVRPFRNYNLEGSTNLATTNWVVLDGYVGNSHSHLQHLTDTNATIPARFYRLREL